MRRRIPRSPLLAPLCALLLAAAGLAACGTQEETEPIGTPQAEMRPAEESFEPGAQAPDAPGEVEPEAPEAPAEAPSAPVAPGGAQEPSAEPEAGATGPGEAGAAGAEPPPAPPAAGSSEVERLQTRVAELERELEAAREELRAARAEAERQEAPRRSDAAIFRDVQRRLLEDSGLTEVALRAEVEDGVVTLHGSVPDRELARSAGALAAGVEGVVRVESRIRVSE